MNRAAYLAIGLVTFVACLVVLAPASLLRSIAADDIDSVPHLRLGTLRGTIWNGTGEFQYRSFPPAGLTWQLDALPLLAGRVQIVATIDGEGLEIVLPGNAAGDSLAVAGGKARVESSYINPVTVAYGLDLSGAFSLAGLSFAFEDDWLTSLSGHLFWEGGIVHIETPEQFHTVKLPPLEGRLSLEGEEALLRVTGGGRNLLDIFIARTGWARVEVMGPLINMTGLEIPGNSGEEGPAFILEEKFF